MKAGVVARTNRVTSSDSCSTFCAEGSERRLESAHAGVTHPLLEGSHLGGETQRPF